MTLVARRSRENARSVDLTVRELGAQALVGGVLDEHRQVQVDSGCLLQFAELVVNDGFDLVVGEDSAEASTQPLHDH
jgi:hypothetical protein